MTATEMTAWIAAGSALLGALIGSIPPIVASIVQARANNAQERLRLAVQIALQEHQLSLEQMHRRAQEAPDKVFKVVPLAGFVMFSAEILERIAAGKTLDVDTVLRLSNEAWQAFGAPPRASLSE